MSDTIESIIGIEPRIGRILAEATQHRGQTMSAAPTIESLAAQLDALLSRVPLTERRFLSVDDAAAYCSVSPESIRRLLTAGKLTRLRPVRGRVSIDRLELDAYVLSSNQRPRRGRGIR